MTTHPDLKDLFVEAIDEYLTTAEWCIGHRKAAGGCLGYPATLLLFCVVDAMGKNLIREEKNKLRHKDVDFRMLGHPSFGLKIEREQIVKLGEWYRHKLAHLALISRGALLSPEENDRPFSFAPNGEPNTIYVSPFYRMVKSAWDKLDRSLFLPSEGLGGPTMPADLLTPEARLFILGGGHGDTSTNPSSGAFSYAPVASGVAVLQHQPKSRH